MNTLYVVIPAYNEESALEKTVLDVLENKFVTQIIIVDNNSNDETNNIGKYLEQSHEKVTLHFEFKKGKGNAFESGLKLCHAADYIGIIDADDTYPAKQFDYLLSEVVNNNLDMIVGNRIASESYSNNDTRFGHVLGNKILSRFIKLISAVEIQDALSGQRIFSKRFIESFRSLSDGFQLETEFSVHCGKNGFSYGERPISYKERCKDNPSKLSTFKDGLKILKFAIMNTAFTLTSKIGLFIGLLFTTLGLFIGFNLLEQYFTHGKVNSVASAVVVSILLSTGIQLFLSSLIESRIRRLEKNIMKR